MLDFERFFSILASAEPRLSFLDIDTDFWNLGSSSFLWTPHYTYQEQRGNNKLCMKQNWFAYREGKMKGKTLGFRWSRCSRGQCYGSLGTRLFYVRDRERGSSAVEAGKGVHAYQKQAAWRGVYEKKSDLCGKGRSLFFKVWESLKRESVTRLSDSQAGGRG